MAKQITREEYLAKATKELGRLVFKPAGYELPETAVSCSWPGGRSDRKKTIGQCWPRAASAAKVNEIFISPMIEDSADAIDILAHELVHAVDDCQNGHKAAFVKICKDIGLTKGKPTSAGAGEELRATIEKIVTKIGQYPHKKLSAGSHIKKQTTRMIKVECGDCGAVFRMSRMWANEVRSCPCCQSENVEVS